MTETDGRPRTAGPRVSRWLGALRGAITGVSRYRLLDTGSKLSGLVLLSAALEVGIVSAFGAVLAIAGAVAGVSTVFVSEEKL